MIRIDLAYLCRPHPDKWRLPLTYLIEDGHEITCTSGLPRLATRLFLREHKLLELFDDISYDTEELSSVTRLKQLPNLCTREWTRERLTFVLSFNGD